MDTGLWTMDILCNWNRRVLTITLKECGVANDKRNIVQYSSTRNQVGAPPTNSIDDVTYYDEARWSDVGGFEKGHFRPTPHTVT